MPNPYDEVSYPTMAESRLHVENLHLRATLNGFSPVGVEKARVLEIGCGTGFNLGPMAAEFPEARFLGLDSSRRAIEKGSAAMTGLGLKNIELRCVDLRELARAETTEALGPFDYVIAHGFYSWVADDVREAMWALVAKVLSPQGVFHVSYNALPGWHAVRAVRDFAGFLSPNRQDPAGGLDKAWDAMKVFARHADSQHPFAKEAARIRYRAKGVLLHDELSDALEPFYLTDVVQRAQRAGFRYAAEAGSQVPGDLRKHEDVARMVLTLSSGDLLLRLQLLDFTAMRRFHDTLFVREAHAPVKRHIVNTLLDCWARSDIRLVEEAAGGVRVYEHSGGVRLTSSHPLLCALADALEDAAPGSVPLGGFLATLQEALSAPDDQLPDDQLTVQFGQMILKLLDGAVIRLRPREVQVARAVSDKPRTSAFARMQMALEGNAPNAYHASVAIPEPWHRTLFTLLDGSRDRKQLAIDLTELSWQEICRAAKSKDGEAIRVAAEFADNPQYASSREALLEFFEERLPGALDKLLRDAYLL